MNKIEIKNLKGEVLFTHTTENNTVLKTLERAVVEKFNLKDINLKGAQFTDSNCRGTSFTAALLTGDDFRDAGYTQEQIDSAITDKTTKF